MGRIKTDLVKRVTKQLVRKYGDEFSEDFSKNKEIVKKHASFQSPKLANVVTGYVTRITRQIKEGKEPL